MVAGDVAGTEQVLECLPVAVIAHHRPALEIREDEVSLGVDRDAARALEAVLHLLFAQTDNDVSVGVDDLDAVLSGVRHHHLAILLQCNTTRADLALRYTFNRDPGRCYDL